MEESPSSCVYEAEQERLRCEEVQREERRRQTEDDFQKELKRIIENEKVSQSQPTSLNRIDVIIFCPNSGILVEFSL